MANQEVYPRRASSETRVSFSPFAGLLDFDDDFMEAEQGAYAEHLPLATIEQIRTPDSFPPPLTELVAQIPRPDPKKFIDQFMGQAKFGERGGMWRLIDKIRYIRYPEGRPPQTYDETIRRAERTGKKEAAVWGEAEIDGHKVVLFASDWDFMRGSVGEAVATKYVEAAQEAAHRGYDLVAVWASGGMRVDEGTVGLVGMEKMELALKEYREKTKGKKCSYVSVLCGVFGGVSASVAPGDVTIGVKRTPFGFTGPNARRAFQGGDVDEEVQMVESHAINNRRVDYLVDSPQEAYDWIRRYLDLAKNKKKNSDRSASALTPIVDSNTIVRNRMRKNAGIYTLLHDEVDGADVSPYIPKKRVEDMDDFERYEDLLRNPHEVDFQDFLRFGVKYVVPLYVGWKFPREPQFLGIEMMHYPAIIAALGKIGNETYLFIGNQPSYYWQTESGTVVKRTATPGPEDCDYEIRMLERVGENLGVTVVRYADTFGALPTDNAERGNISEKLMQAANAARNYPERSICIKEVDASGGGRPTAAWADARAARKHSQTYIAEPTSNLVISSNAAPTREQVRQQVENMKDIRPQHQVELGIIQDIIDEPEGGGVENPGGVIFEMAKYIARASARLNKKPVKALLKERFDNLRNTQILLEKVE